MQRPGGDGYDDQVTSKIGSKLRSVSETISTPVSITHHFKPMGLLGVPDLKREKVRKRPEKGVCKGDIIGRMPHRFCWSL